MNKILDILLENIDKPDSLFIFPTDIAASGWADYLLREKGGTIAMNKFTAWDIFKQNSIKSKVQNKKSVPSAIRKIFISRLISENTESVKKNTLVFTSLIYVKWAENAAHFTPWLTRLLPQLGSWFKKATGLSIDKILSNEAEKAAVNFKDEDRDMFVLSKRYAHFLDEYKLFEPAWETPPFNNEGKKCFLFFPESLSDYCEYRELLTSSGHVRIINVENHVKSDSNAFYYTNARREITEATLYICSLHEKQNISWDSIAVCFPDPEYYEPYVIREFENRNIPWVKRSSKPLADFPAGRFFGSILDCTSQDLSFASLVSLLTNKYLPWKNTDLIDKLIDFGINNNCLYSWVEKTKEGDRRINVWENALNNPIDGIEPLVFQYFNVLKNYLHSLRNAISFSELRKQYFIFREQFFDMNLCSTETDLILSRCISELMNLVELERNFPDVPALDPFVFFVECLTETNYLAQTVIRGVNILPYKTVAAAPFDCHIILGADQNNLSVVFKRLDFLPVKKREMLGIYDEDVSDIYINMHKYNSLKSSAFFCSEQSFSGYAIAHSKTGAPSKPKENYSSDPQFEGFFSQDYYFREFSSDNSNGQLILHDNQINGFEEWKNRRKQNNNLSGKSSHEEIKNYINNKLVNKAEFPGKISVSATALKTYYQCSLIWLFEHILCLDNVQIETSLMDKNLSGIVYHLVLEKFLSQLINEALLKPVVKDYCPVLPDTYNELLHKCIDNIFQSFPSIRLSSLSARFLRAGKNTFLFNLERFLVQFISLFNGYKVTGSETWYKTPHENYFLNGKLDCILEDKDNNLVIVDFKMFKLPKRSSCIFKPDTTVSAGVKKENDLEDFQLPMYITLAEESEENKKNTGNEKKEVHTALFFSILELKAEVIIGTVHNILTNNVYPKKDGDRIYRDGETYNQLIKKFKEKTQTFADEIISGNLSIYESDPKKCLKCKYNRICRMVCPIKNEKNISIGKN